MVLLMLMFNLLHFNYSPFAIVSLFENGKAITYDIITNKVVKPLAKSRPALESHCHGVSAVSYVIFKVAFFVHCVVDRKLL